MTTDMSEGPGAFRRLMNKMATWSGALDYSGFDYSLDRIAFVERELAEIKDRLRQFEATRHEPHDVSVSRRNPPTMWDMASLGFSHISVAEPGRLAFLSGQIAVMPGREVPQDLAGQAKVATASLAAALKELGASAQDIVMLRVYVVNATGEAFGQAVAPLHELLGGVMPSITTIGVQALYKPEIKVEIEMAVRLP